MAGSGFGNKQRHHLRDGLNSNTVLLLLYSWTRSVNITFDISVQLLSLRSREPHRQRPKFEFTFRGLRRRPQGERIRK